MCAFNIAVGVPMRDKNVEGLLFGYNKVYITSILAELGLA